MKLHIQEEKTTENLQAHGSLLIVTELQLRQRKKRKKSKTS